MAMQRLDELTESSQHLRLVGHHDLGGFGDGMQVMLEGDALYVGHHGTTGMGTSILDASDHRALELVEQWPAPRGTHTHKVQVADGLLLVNHERFGSDRLHSAGMMIYDIERPLEPRPIGFFRATGLGVHRIVWTGGDYAYVSATPEGFSDRIFVVVDMRDPERPVEAGRWWMPGMFAGGGEEHTWPADVRYAAHHALLDGDLAYLGYDDAGMVILDLSDVSNPRHVSTTEWPGVHSTHTCMPLPGRSLVVATDEETTDLVARGEHRIRLIDVAEPETPRVVSMLPSPGLEEFGRRGRRFGPHNLHENRRGSYRSAEIVFATYFNAGLRVYDVKDAERPLEIASWVAAAPEGNEVAQINDLFVADDGRIYVTDRVAGGVYVLEPDEVLAQRMEEARLTRDPS